MTGVALRFELTDFKSIRNKFDPKTVDRALNLALNVASRKARVQISKDVRETYTVKARDLTKAVSIKKITSGRGRYARLVLYRGNVLGLDKFSPTKRVIRTDAGKRRGVSIRIRKDRGRKIVRGAFSADVHGVKVFRRTSEARPPIKRLFGPSVPQMVSNKLVIDQVSRDVNINLAAEFNRQMIRLTQRR